jgi:hypothetical protein
MSGSSIWAIAVLVVASAVTFITLITEKQEQETPAGLRKWRRTTLVVLTTMALILGLGQIIKSGKESRKAEKDHATEHDADKAQISILQRSLTMLGQVNQTQYDRSQGVLRELQGQVTQLKLGKLTEEDRKKISSLEAQLKAAMAPKPKAKLAFGFYEPVMKQGDVRVEKYFSVEGDVLKLDLVIHNTSDVKTGNIAGWIRVCNECKLHNEPPDSIKERGSPAFERHYKIPDVSPGVAAQIADVEVETPRWMLRMPISFSYTCDECDAKLDEQIIWANLGRIPEPKQPIK